MTYYRCPVKGCEFTTKSIHGLRVHYRRMHSVFCFVCDKQFHRQAEAPNHARRKIRADPTDIGHMALYALTKRRLCDIKGTEREMIYKAGLDALRELTEINEEVIQ